MPLTKKVLNIWLACLLIVSFASISSCSPIKPDTSGVNPTANQAKVDEKDVIADIYKLFQDDELEPALKKVNAALSNHDDVPELHLAKARIINEMQGAQAALDYLTKVVNSHPLNPGMRAARGQLLLELDYLESAKKDFIYAYQHDYKSIDVLRFLLKIENENGNYKNSLNLVKEALSLVPDDSQLWFLKSQLEIRLRDIEAAEQSCFRALQLNDDDIRFHQLYVEILNYQKRDEEAARHVEDAYQKFPYDSWASIQYSAVLIADKKYEAARSVLAKTMEKKPDDYLLYFQMATVYSLEKNWPKTIENLKDGLKINPKATRAKVELAKVYFQVGDIGKAIDELNQAREENTKDAFVYETLASYYNRKNDTFEAERIILEGLDINPNNANLILEYATILEKRSKYKEAIKAYEEILQRNPKDPNILGKLGHLNKLAGNYQKAAEYFQSAIKEKPDLTWIRSFYAELLLDQEKWEPALDQVNQILNLEPNDYWALAQKAQIQYLLEHYTAAYDSITKAIKSRPDVKQLRRIEGEILESLKRYKEAERAFKEALQSAPDSSYLLSKLGYIQLILDKNQALVTVKKALDSEDFDIATIELYLYLTGQSAKVWGFDKTGPEAAILTEIIHKDFSKVKAALADLRKSGSPHAPFLELLLKIVKTEKLKGQNTDQLDKIPNLSGWHYFYLGMIALARDQNEAAKTFFQKGLKLEPDNPWIKIKLAYAHQQLQEHQAAIDLLKQYLDEIQFGDKIWVKLRLALNYDLTKQYKASEAVYLNILSIDPNENLALNNLAWMYLTTTDPEMKKRDKALELALKAVEISPSAANLDTLAEAYYQKKEYQKALKAIERALDTDKNNMDDFKKTQKKILKAIESQHK